MTELLLPFFTEPKTPMKNLVTGFKRVRIIYFFFFVSGWVLESGRAFGDFA